MKVGIVGGVMAFPLALTALADRKSPYAGQERREIKGLHGEHHDGPRHQ